MNPLVPFLKLYRKIPDFTCLPGCSDCCGPVPFAKEEWDAVADKRNGVNVVCPYAVGGRCECYRNRPFICRLYGASDDLPCPRGFRPKVRLTVHETNRLMSKYRELMGRG